MTTPIKFDYDTYISAVNDDRDDISTGMATTPGYIAFYGAQAELWLRVVADKEDALDLQEAIQLDKVKSGEKITDALAKAKVELTDEVQEAKKKLRLSNEQAGLYKRAVAAFDIKSKMLSGRNANRRSEQENLHNSSTEVASSRDEMHERRKRFSS